jgi:hypothetical protein
MYTLRFPFTLPPGREIAVAETPGELDGLEYRLSKQDRFYVLTLSGFASEESAQAYLKDIRAALIWLLLHTGIAANGEFEPQPVAYSDDPHQWAVNLSLSFRRQIDGPVDALVDGARPAVYVTGNRIRLLTPGLVSVVMITPAEIVMTHFAAGIGIENSTRVVEDPKLLTAFELFAAYFTEASGNARFLTLVMAIETLATGVQRTRLVLDLLEKWKQKADEALKTVAPDSDDAASLQAVCGELLIRRKDSIGRQVRNVIFTTLTMNGDADAAEAVKRVVRLYKLRSRLVHKGSLTSQELNEGMTDAKNLVERVLRARFLLTAAGRL